MNNQIETKFRAWDTELNKFTDEGEFIFKQYGDVRVVFMPNSIEYSHDQIHRTDYNYSRFIVQQFTGRYDKNKKEIYNGDIIITNNCYYISDNIDNHPEGWKIYNGTKDFERNSKGKELHYIKYAVKYNYNKAGYSPFCVINRIDSETCEIIGHIFENPKLTTNYE